MLANEEEKMPCEHHVWFMGAKEMRCANCDLVMTPEPVNIGEWDGTYPTYNAETKEWGWIKK